ncbi:MAG: hypothetical protein ACFFCD_03710 [Promethearchaeota archaeon]
MQDLPQTIRYPDLCRELREFIQGKSTLSTVKDFFSVFWNSVKDKHDLNDEIIAKTEILEIAVESYENEFFSIDDLRTILQSHEE